MTKKTPEKVNIVLYGACFALCFFAFMLTEASINERCAEVVGKQFVNLVYAVGLVCTGLGYLSFPALRRLCKGKDARKIMLCMIGLCCAAASFLLIKAQGPVLFLISSAGALFFFGHIGGSVFYNTAMFFNGNRFMGRIIGFGMGIAILLQYLVQNLAPQAIVLIVSDFLSVAFVLYFTVKAPKD